ncbi:MAG: BACON domain-containing protein [Bacteroidales bacterium]
MKSRIQNYLSGITLFTLLLLAFTACNDEKNGPGLQNVDTLCFTIDGGDTSEELVAEQAWSISVNAGTDPWLTVSPLSGGGSTDPINLIFKALVNNNAQSRTAEVTITIGTKKYTYSVFQDGTTENSCNN